MATSKLFRNKKKEPYGAYFFKALAAFLGFF